MEVDQLKQLNRKLAGEITRALEQFILDTGTRPEVSIDWHTDLGGSSHPIVKVEAVVK